MSSNSPSPTGLRILAQGNALGLIRNIKSRSPKGSHILAQGNVLGQIRKFIRRLKACNIAPDVKQTMKQTYSLRSISGQAPRALPWASMRETLGLKERGSMGFRPLAFGVLLLTAPALSAATFDEQRAVVSASPVTQSEAAIISLLKAGIDEGKPTQAISEAQKWLRQNLPENPQLLYFAGRAAELSGDASAAAALYEQFLKKADPKDDAVGTAVIAVNFLFKNQLNDPDAAFSFGRNGADRLASNPAARQFDEWFLDEAMRRKDAVAAANRLHADIKAGVSNDLLEVVSVRAYNAAKLAGKMPRHRSPRRPLCWRNIRLMLSGSKLVGQAAAMANTIVAIRGNTGRTRSRPRWLQWLLLRPS